jgi:hypothetical protein
MFILPKAAKYNGSRKFRQARNADPKRITDAVLMIDGAHFLSEMAGNSRSARNCGTMKAQALELTCKFLIMSETRRGATRPVSGMGPLHVPLQLAAAPARIRQEHAYAG